MMGRAHQSTPREGQVGLAGGGVRPVLPEKPGNAGGGKGPWFEGSVESGEVQETGVSLQAPT